MWGTTHQNKQRPVYWLNKEEFTIRKHYNSARHRLQRNQPTKIDWRKHLKAKSSSFNKLWEEANKDHWGTAYKICMSIFKNKQHKHYFRNTIRFSHWKRTVAIEKNDKATRMDGIPNTSLKEVTTLKPYLFAKMYNACIKEEVFPDTWKLPRLVLLPKPKKTTDEPLLYRPLCILDTMQISEWNTRTCILHKYHYELF